MKKNIIVIIAMIFITNITFAQNRAIKQFYKKYDRSEESVTKFNVNSWMMGLGKLVLKMADDGTDEMKLAIKLSGDVKKGKFMVIEKEKATLKDDITSLIRSLHQDSYEDLISIRDKGSKINIMIQEEGNSVKNVIFLVHEPDNFVMMSLEVDIDMDALNQLIKESNMSKRVSVDVVCNEN